ncbi:Nucleoporin 153kD [Carabus blaptoides fortunei]
MCTECSTEREQKQRQPYSHKSCVMCSMMAKSDNGELNRSVTDANSSDPNNSLLQKVTKRVSGLIPSSFTKWFGQPGDSGSVIRRRESIDDEDDTDTTQIQPPKKRAKPSTSTADVDFSATVNNFALTTSTPVISSRNDLRHMQAGPSAFTRHTTTSQQQFQVRNQRNESATATITNGDDKSDSGDSTSGYSSVPAQQHKESSLSSDRVNMQAQPSTSKTSPNKSLDATFNSSRSLFSEQSLNPQRACLSARRPTFSASTFGSPSFVDRTLSTKRAVNSPFYGGRTMYGGASAYRKRCRMIFPRDETNNVVVKNSVEMKPVNTDAISATSSVNLGKTARRILDALEHFTSPVLDAKKIPAVTRSVADLSKSAAARRSPYARETKAASNQELLVPAVPDLLKMKLKSRLQDSTVQVRKVATTSTSVLNSSEYTIRTVENTAKPQKHSSKMKTKISAVRESKSDQNDIVDAVKLPEVQLSITDLPKFDFCLPPPPPILTPVKLPKSVEKRADKLSFPISKSVQSMKSTVKPFKPQNAAQFQFASPIFVQNAPKSVATVNSYKFSEPLDAKHLSEISSAVTFKASDSSTAPRRKDSSKNNGQTSNTFSLQPAAQFVSGSVMDILGNKDNQTPVKPEAASSKPAKDTTSKSGDSLMDMFKPAIGTWECTACMVRNLPTAARCLACETLKEPPQKSKTAPAVGFGAQFKMAADKWECSACMIRNNQADTACVACTTPKPGTAKPNAPAAGAGAALSGFGMQFKPAEGTWECSSCMIRNKSDTVKCVACESPKPGSTSDKPSLVMPPTAPLISGAGFGDFIKKQQQSNNWECQSCMVRNPSEKTQCLCCDTPKPGVQPETKTPSAQFKFGINQAATTAASGFKFGIDKSNETKSTTTFSFGIQPVAKPVDSSSSAVSTSTAAPTGFTFGIPATDATKVDEKQTETPVSVTNTITPLPVVSKTSTATAAASDAPKAFTFGRPTTTSQPPSATNAKTTLSFQIGTNNTSSTTTAALPTFSFTTTTTAPVITTAPVTVTKSNPVTTFSSTPGSSIFGSAVSTPDTSTVVPANTISFSASTKSVTASSAVVTTAVTSSTFSFGATSSKPVTFGSENSLPQFNFGAGSLPFNPSTGSVTSGSATVANTTAVTASSFGANTSAFGGANTATFNFTPPPNTTAPVTNKAAIKPFAFGNGDAKATPTFSFAQKDKPAIVPLAKGPVFNFGALSNTKPGDGFNSSGSAPNTTMFSFNAGKPETKPPPAYGAATTSTSGGVFGGPVASTPQNGGFNFGATSATPNFNFGENSGFNNAGAFGFGGQTGTGSTVPPAASAGVFAFGGAHQQQTPTFTPAIKPNFNFTSGTVPNFTAQAPSPTPGAIVQRKIRKAVRRTQPR